MRFLSQELVLGVIHTECVFSTREAFGMDVFHEYMLQLTTNKLCGYIVVSESDQGPEESV